MKATITIGRGWDAPKRKVTADDYDGIKAIAAAEQRKQNASGFKPVPRVTIGYCYEDDGTPYIAMPENWECYSSTTDGRKGNRMLAARAETFVKQMMAAFKLPESKGRPASLKIVKRYYKGYWSLEYLSWTHKAGMFDTEPPV